MSGFLKTLAQRVLQSDAPIRPRTNLPFAGSVSSLESEESITALGPAAWKEGNVVTNYRETAEFGGNRPSESKWTEPAQTPLFRELSIGDEKHAPAVVENTEGRVRSQDGRGDPRYETRAQTAAQRHFEPLVPTVPTPEQQAAVRHDPARLTVEAVTARARPRVDAATERIRRRSEQSETGFPDAHGEVQEVHVSIGRIELTAVTPQSVSKPARGPVRKPMALEEYLERRAREKR